MLFLALCVMIAWLCAATEKNIHICEKGGNVLFLTDQDYTKLNASGMNLDTFKCVERVLTQDDLWNIKRAYRRSSL
jgi:hypothetical protein